jgi:hypothetical protein
VRAGASLGPLLSPSLPLSFTFVCCFQANGQCPAGRHNHACGLHGRHDQDCCLHGRHDQACGLHGRHNHAYGLHGRHDQQACVKKRVLGPGAGGKGANRGRIFVFIRNRGWKTRRLQFASIRAASLVLLRAPKKNYPRLFFYYPRPISFAEPEGRAIMPRWLYRDF